VSTALVFISDVNYD